MLSFRPVGVVMVILYIVGALGIGLKRRIPMRHQVLPFILFIYLLGVVGVTLFPIPVDPAMRYINAGNNLVPFRTMVGVMGGGTANALLNIAGNIVLFLPFGFLWPLVLQRLNRTATIVGLGFAATLTVELSQLVLSAMLGTTYRSFDVDDLITNTVGVICGYGLVRLVQRFPLTRRTLALGAASLVFVTAVSAGGYRYVQHTTPQKTLEMADPNVSPLDSVPFANGVVLITTTDPARFEQQGYVAWYLQKRFWGWQVQSVDLLPAKGAGSITIDGEAFAWHRSPR